MGLEVTHTHTIPIATGVISLAVIGGGAGIAIYLNKIIRGKKSISTASAEPIRELLFFPDPHPTCRSLYTERQGCHDPNCRYSHDPNSSFSKLMSHLNSARKSIDMCIFCFTSPELASAVITLHKRGVRVRFITDNEQIDASSSQVGNFRKEGIIVRHNETSYFMHHKFVIIDNKKLVNGSFNWTRQAVMGNNENVVISTDQKEVGAFLSEFEKLWINFDPVKF